MFNNLICPNSDRTVLALLSKYVSDITSEQFLNTSLPVPAGLNIPSYTNWEKIQRNYNAVELKENKDKFSSSDFDNILVKSGTNLVMPQSYIKRDLPKKSITDLIESTGFKPFISSKLAELLRDPSYTRTVNSFSGEKLATIDNNDITVYAWCRSLTNANDTSQSGSWINISAFVEVVQTTVSSGIGQFSLALSPVSCEWSNRIGDNTAVENGYVTQGGWIPVGTSGYNSGNMRDDVLIETSLLKFDPKNPGEYLRQNAYLNTVLQENDLIYIKFEKLDADREEAVNNSTVDGRIDSRSVVGKVWDMIGLVDTVSISAIPNNAVVNVSGRDLMKVLIEDGSIFFPAQFAQQIFTNEDSLLTKRNRYELEAQSLSAASYTFKSIETILKFIFNKFSNLGVVPNIAFNGYGDGAIKSKFELKTSELTQKSNKQVIDKLNDTFAKEDRQGIWRILDLIFDPQIAKRVLADNSISQDNGSIINSIRKICQEPLVEFYGDTYGDKYDFIVRKPPFDKKGYTGLVYDNCIVDNNNDGVNTYTSNKSIIDKDSGKISSSKLNNNFKDRLNRDKKIRSLSEVRSATLSPLVIEIDDIDVLGNPVLTYHNEAYSWYRAIPRGLGITDEASEFLLAPIVPLDEYAKVFGNRTFSIEYNYAPSEYLNDSQVQSESKYIESQAFYDLQFCIQSNQYLPFTRRGTITLAGNRTIKRGLFIYFKPTKEVFYVDSVTNIRSMEGRNNRITVLEVSRGMREPYIKGKLVHFPSGDKLVSYFNIVNTDIANDASIDKKDFLKNWKEDTDLFSFFIQRRQWID